MTQNNVIEYNVEKLSASASNINIIHTVIVILSTAAVIYSNIIKKLISVSVFTIISSLNYIIHRYNAVNTTSKLRTPWEMHLHALLFRPAGKAS